MPENQLSEPVTHIPLFMVTQIEFDDLTDEEKTVFNHYIVEDEILDLPSSFNMPAVTSDE